MPFAKILALTDLSENSCAGLALADSLAHRYHGKITLGYVHTRLDVLRDYGGDVENTNRLRTWVRSEDETHLRNLGLRYIDRLRLAAVETVDVASAREGVPLLVQRIEPDLVCMATHGRTGVKHMLLGSIAEHTLRTSRVPVVVTKGAPFPAHDQPLRVFLGLDLVDEPAPMVRRVMKLVGPEDELIYGHVVESCYYSPAAYGSTFSLPQPDVPKLREAAQARLEALEAPPGGPKLRVDVRAGHPGDGLLDAERELKPDLVVARTHGRRGFDHMMLGSVSEQLARRCTAPVLIYPKVG